ncbi:dynein light chain binding protein [Aureococcus anophagefferens]|nr:dynein light chain binding protein [Aureococcus anophagefferens]
MAQPPPRDGPRLRALDQRSLLKVSMKSRREQMKDNRDKAYASRGKKKLRGMLRAAAHQVKYTHDDRSELVRLLEEGQDPASIVGPLGAFRELPPRVASASDLLRSYGVDQTAKPLHRSQSLRQYDLGADDAAALGSARALRTRGAAHYVTPTDRIARLYTPTAATLTMRDATAFEAGVGSDSLGAKARDDALTRVARVAPAAYHAAARTAAGGFGESMSLDESSDGDAVRPRRRAGRAQVSIVDEAPRDAEPAPKPAPATPTSPSKRRQLAREARRGRGAVLRVAVGRAGDDGDALRRGALEPGRPAPGNAGDDASVSSVADAPREAARYQEAALLRERAKVLRARQTVRTREGGPDGDQVGELALEKSIDHFLEGHLDDGVEDQNDHWSFSAVERERVADEALEESRLGFADGAAGHGRPRDARREPRGALDIDPAHLRAAPRWWTSVEHRTYEWRVLRKTGVARRRVHRAFYAAATQLRVVERVMYELHEAWLLPRQPAAFGAAAAPAAAPPAIAQSGEAAKDDDDDAEGDDDDEELGNGRRSPDVPASLAAAARHHLIAPEDADAFQEAGDGDSAADEFDARLRSLCEESLDHFVAFFERFDGAIAKLTDEAAFELGLRLDELYANEDAQAVRKRHVVVLEPSLERLQEHCCDCIESIIRAAQRFPRVDVSAALGAGGPASPAKDAPAATTLPVLGVLDTEEDGSSAASGDAERGRRRRRGGGGGAAETVLEAHHRSPDEFLARDDRARGRVEIDATEASLTELSKMNDELSALADRIRGVTGDLVDSAMFRVQTAEAKELLAAKADALNLSITESVAADNREHMQDVCRKYQNIADQLVDEPTTSAELRTLKEFSEQAIDMLKGLEHEYKEEILQREKLLARGYRSDELQENRKKHLKMVVEGQREQLGREVASLEKKVEKLAETGSLAPNEVQMVTRRVQAIREGLDNAQKESEIVVAQEDLLELQPTDHEARLAVDAEDAAARAAEYGTTLNRVVKLLEKKGPSRDPARRACKLLIQEAAAFEQDEIPLMRLVCEPGMQQRHWDEIKRTTRLNFDVSPATNVLQLMDVGLNHYVHLIEDTCVAASKEAALDKALVKMEAAWGSAIFATGVAHGRILAGIDEIQQELDDQIVKTQAMHGSRYVKPFLGRVEAWEHTLTSLHIIDNWLKVQAAWLYLEPIFSSDDITRQMPTEASLFTTVNQVWIDSMAETAADPALLEILAETKDPTRVQPHLKKCFDGVANLEFTKNLDIMACLDAPAPKGERLEFAYDACNHKMINPKDSGGNVEKWLVEVEAIMKKSLANAIDEAVVDFEKNDRKSWLAAWQGQVVLTVNQITWGQLTEAAINRGKHALAELHGKRVDELMDVVEQVRGNIPKALRSTLGALVVMDVHNRDITDELAKSTISSPLDFDWQAQLRYYWEEGGASAQSGTPGTIPCRMINAMILRGPAGTGKTETTKDLGKAIAIQCVVTNCSDGLDYKAMGKFFKGLAASGAWACFDEFNRIQLEVLSVIAQQVLTIQQAKARKAERFMFEGTDLPLKPTCCPFITMNPGYAGRAELPDNLKVLFRTVAMMVPDYGMIGEILLYSMGYTDAKAMAIKIVTTYKLCSEQLSAQSHYDYGMRAVMAVLRAAGNLKRAEGHLPEDVLVLRSIIDVNLPKFLSPDPTKYFWEKVVQIYDMMVVRHGFMIVGMPFSGKTSAWKVLATRSGRSTTDTRRRAGRAVVPFLMNPKSITMGQLYGQFDDVSHEWTDGVLAINYRNAATSKVGNAEDRKWVLLDGPVDAIWIENMNTVLDDNKKLCLMSGEIIAMSDVMSMIFEPMDLLVASPATVSRCGMVYMEPEQLGLRPSSTPGSSPSP